MALMGMGIECGDTVTVKIEGADEDTAAPLWRSSSTSICNSGIMYGRSRGKTAAASFDLEGGSPNDHDSRQGVSAGVGVGPLYFYRRATAEIRGNTVEIPTPSGTASRVRRPAQSKQLGVLAEQAAREVGDKAAMLFETHQMMAEDLDYEEAIEDRIVNQKNERRGRRLRHVRAVCRDVCLDGRRLYAGPRRRRQGCQPAHSGHPVRHRAGRHCVRCAGAALR